MANGPEYGEIESGEVAPENVNQDESDQDNPNWGMPPEPKHWPTAEDLQRAKAIQPDPREVIKELRRWVRPAGPKALSMRICC